LNAFRKGKRIINQGGVNVIYSSFGPYADHLVAYFLKRKFPEIRWIADFRDLQIEPLYNNVFFRRWQIQIEQKLLQKADVVTTVSVGLSKHLEKYGRRTLAVPRGVELRTNDIKMYPKFTICYTGSLYQHFRDAKCFFRVLSELIHTNQISQNEIQFLYAGRDGNQFRNWVDEYHLQKIFKDLGVLTKTAAWEVQNRSHIQLLLTTSTKEWSGVLTGKLFEYLESGNAIIVLVNGVSDMEFERLMDNTGAGKVFYDPPDEEKSLGRYLLDHYRSWKETGKLEMQINTRYIVDEMSWEFQAEKMLTGIGM
jgi:hypothetical protein